MADAEKRVGGIDLLRGLCIIAVILNHINLRIRLNQSAFGKWIGPTASDALVWNGHDGVRVFFVISGFLITTWTLKRWGALRHINGRQFYAMRFARIVPCLLGLLALLAVLDRLGAPRFTIDTRHTTLGGAIFAALTFHVNWLEARTGYLPAAWDILWSLSVEEVFYLFFPILCAALRKPFLRIAVFCGLIVVGPYARVHMPHGLWADYGYRCCMDGIAFGCLAAMASARFRFGRGGNLAMCYLGAAVAAFITIFTGAVTRLGLYKAGLDETVLEIAIACVLIGLQQMFEREAAEVTAAERLHNAGPVRKLLDAPSAALRWFGRNSYEVYLTHMLVVWPIVGIFYRAQQSIQAGPIWFVAAIFLAGALGSVVARYYSEPLNRRLRRKLITPAKSGAAASESVKQSA